MQPQEDKSIGCVTNGSALSRTSWVGLGHALQELTCRANLFVYRFDVRNPFACFCHDALGVPSEKLSLPQRASRSSNHFQSVFQPRPEIFSGLPLNWTSEGSSLKFSMARLPSVKR